jgi:hypothetical protein
MLTVPMVSQHLKCSPQTVYALIRDGRLPASRRLANPRGAWQVAPEALQEFVDAERRPAGELPVAVA